MKALIAGLAVAALAAGCKTVTMSSPGTLSGVDVNGAGGRADRVISISNEGYFLFHCLPLATGNLNWVPAARKVRRGAVFFEDHLAGDKMVDAMTRYADSQNCDLVDIVVNDKNQCPIGLFSVLEWFNTVVAYRTTTYSGVLCPRGRDGKGGAGK